MSSEYTTPEMIAECTWRTAQVLFWPLSIVMVWIVLPILGFFTFIAWIRRYMNSWFGWERAHLILADILRTEAPHRREAILDECLKLCTDENGDFRTQSLDNSSEYFSEDEFEVVKALSQRQAVFEHYLKKRQEEYHDEEPRQA